MNSTDPFAAFDDGLNEALGVKTTASPKAPPANYRPTDLTEPCAKCRGTGSYRGYGQCFACQGKGKITRRQAGARKAVVTAAINKQAKAQAFAAEHKVELEWLHAVANREETKMGTPPFKYWEFPVKLRNSLSEYGTLTDGQVEAIRKCMAKDAARKVERAEAAPVADTAGIDRLKAAFDAAAAYTASKAKGLTKRNPKISIGSMVISPAKATSANPGALYVKAGETYLGKIAGGRFLASRDCSEAQQTQILAFVADPAKAAQVYGQETGICCICNATLRSEWRLRGIGPICSEKFGW